MYKHNPLVLMVSASRDGDYLARLIEKHGFSAVRGAASNRKGAKEAIELIKELRRGKHCEIGCRRKSGPSKGSLGGPSFFAGKTRGLILPMAYSASRYITFKTWDGLILPKLLFAIDDVYGKPFTVPKDMKAVD